MLRPWNFTIPHFVWEQIFNRGVWDICRPVSDGKPRIDTPESERTDRHTLHWSIIGWILIRRSRPLAGNWFRINQRFSLATGVAILRVSDHDHFPYLSEKLPWSSSPITKCIYYDRYWNIILQKTAIGQNNSCSFQNQRLQHLSWVRN
jgi:hypothetical protein